MNLFSSNPEIYQLPLKHKPRKPRYFKVDRIVMARGSLADSGRRDFVKSICELYPEAEIVKRLDSPHNKIDFKESDPLMRTRKGKSTIVFGEHKSAVRFSEEGGNTCPNYWHFSPYSFCFYGCKYCYLSGTRTFWHSPSVKIFLNLGEILRKIDKTARRIGKPVAFYLGKLQDGLALDPLTGYSSITVPFFAKHEYARMIVLTKSDEVKQLLDLDHNRKTILSWSLNPPEISTRFEENIPPIESRLKAMKQCSENGYTVRAVIMPVIPVEGWEILYEDFVHNLLSEIPVERLTIGGICIYRNAKRLMDRKLGEANEISSNIADEEMPADGRARYPAKLRFRMYRRIIDAAREIRPEIEIALCLEELPVWQALGIEHSIGRCNCVL